MEGFTSVHSVSRKLLAVVFAGVASTLIAGQPAQAATSGGSVRHLEPGAKCEIGLPVAGTDTFTVYKGTVQVRSVQSTKRVLYWVQLEQIDGAGRVIPSAAPLVSWQRGGGGGAWLIPPDGLFYSLPGYQIHLTSSSPLGIPPFVAHVWVSIYDDAAGTSAAVDFYIGQYDKYTWNGGFRDTFC